LRALLLDCVTFEPRTRASAGHYTRIWTYTEIKNLNLGSLGRGYPVVSKAQHKMK